MSSKAVIQVHDLDHAAELWGQLMPEEVVTDLWEVRMAFHRHFRRPCLFLLEETDGIPTGLLPLSWVAEQREWAFFPGETWRGKTWLEQNQIPSRNATALLASIPGTAHIRYLSPRRPIVTASCQVDETGYLFRPSLYDYDMDNYRQVFSGKSLKRIAREIEGINARGITWRLDRFEDLDIMVAMNIAHFKEASYFADSRFRKGFLDTARLFKERGWLRVTTALVGSTVAAVDMGVLYKNVYTLMAGGTDPAYPGIAKLINFHHMERACRESMDEVDFLCGDFNWKKMFHLTERPLYLFTKASVQVA